MSEDRETAQIACVFLTDHAIARFRDRSWRALGNLYTEAEAQRRMQRLLSFAEPETATRAMRRAHLSQREASARARGETVEFWTAGGWRFVVVIARDQASRVLVTCERTNPAEN